MHGRGYRDRHPGSGLGAKAGLRGSHGIIAQWQFVEEVIALITGRGWTSQSGSRVAHGDFGAGDRRAGRIGDCSFDSATKCLRLQRARKQKNCRK